MLASSLVESVPQQGSFLNAGLIYHLFFLFPLKIAILNSFFFDSDFIYFLGFQDRVSLRSLAILELTL